MTHRIGVIGGDGIGPEVVAEALKVVRRGRRRATTPSTTTSAAPATCATASCSPTRSSRSWRGLDAILLGAVGTPDVPPGVIERGLLLEMRFELDLYVNLRPFRRARRSTTASTSSSSARTPRAPTPARAASCARARRTRSRPRDRSTPGMGVERCVRFAFDLARSRDRASTSRSCTRPTCSPSPATSGSARSTRWPPSTPTSTTAYNHVDAACIYFVQDPGRYDVIVTDNLFGDILTDLGGAVAGGIGRAASANLNPARTGPVAVRAGPRLGPRHRGHRARPIPRAAIISAAMMLEFLGEADAAARIQKAVRRVRRR